MNDILNDRLGGNGFLKMERHSQRDAAEEQGQNGATPGHDRSPHRMAGTYLHCRREKVSVCTHSWQVAAGLPSSKTTRAKNVSLAESESKPRRRLVTGAA